MNAFQKVIDKQTDAAVRLGNPSADSAVYHQRMNAMATMTGANGFRIPPMAPRVDAQGKTRGERKRAIRAAAMARVSETRAPEFMHSAARQRAGYEYDWRSNGYVQREAA